MATKPSREAIDHVLALNTSLVTKIWAEMYGRAEIDEFYPNSLQGVYQCKTDFDRGRSFAKRIWSTFMAEYITRRVSQ